MASVFATDNISQIVWMMLMKITQAMPWHVVDLYSDQDKRFKFLKSNLVIYGGNLSKSSSLKPGMLGTNWLDQGVFKYTPN